MDHLSEVIEISPDLALTYSTANLVRKTRKSLTLKAKLDIIKRVENGERKSDVATSLGLAKSTVRTIVQNSETIRESARRCTPLTSRKITVTRNHVLETMERMLCGWINELNVNKKPVTQRIIMEKARSMYKELSAEDSEDSVNANIPFLASRGWFDRFRKRVNLKNVKIQPDGSQLLAFDEAAPVSVDTSEPHPLEKFLAIKTEIGDEMIQDETKKNDTSNHGTYIITELPSLTNGSLNGSKAEKICSTDKSPRQLPSIIKINHQAQKLPDPLPADKLHRAFELMDEVVEIFRCYDPIQSRSKRVAAALHSAVSCYIPMYQTETESNETTTSDPSGVLRINSIEEISTSSECSSGDTTDESDDI